MTQHKQAVVIGGSMAGLLAARALSNHFAKVVVVERDALPDGAEFRNGVPQARHAHALLAQGQQLMEAMFPALKQDFIEAGSPAVLWGRDGMLQTAAGWVTDYPSDLVMNMCSRVWLEWRIRTHLQQIPGVEFLTETLAHQLVLDDAKQRAIGIEIEHRRTHEKQILPGDLIVDATGRESKTSEWLQSLGYPTPEITEINAFLGYSTRWYKIPENYPGKWKYMAIASRPKDGLYRSGGILTIEGNRWTVILSGANEDYPPTDDEGFLAFAKSLATPHLYEAIKDAEPITPVYGYRRTQNMLRHYEKLTRRPENFIITGDAVCTFNPAYGQGMTVAALEAHKLDELLRQHGTTDLTGFAEKFQKALVNVTSTAWLMATGADLQYPKTTGKRPGAAAQLAQTYMNTVLEMTTYDAEAAATFVQVMNMLRPPTILFNPSLMLRVIRHKLSGAKQENKPHLLSELQQAGYAG